MKHIIFSLCFASIVAGCTCEEPEFIPPSGIPKIISPPLDGETTTELFGIFFSETMNTESVSMETNTTITVDNVPVQDTSVFFNWETGEELYIDIFSSVLNNCSPCIIEVEFHDKTDADGKFYSEDGQVLDGDCNGVQGGVYRTTFIF